MVELIHLINDISTPVKLGWAGVLVWGAVQFVWYQRGRALPEDMDVEQSGALSIAPAFDLPVHESPEHEADLGAAAGVALESLLDADGSFGEPKKRVSYQSTMSY